MIRNVRCAIATFLSALGIASLFVAACRDPDCADVASCATAITADAGTDTTVDVTLDAPPAEKPYPKASFGWTPRAPGSSSPGSVIPNVVFEQTVKPQLVPPAGALPLERSELADLYDPEGKSHDVIILVLATEWDANTKGFLDGLGAMPVNTVVVTALGQNITAAPAKLEDFERWVKALSWAWNVLDSGFGKLAKLQELYGDTYPKVFLIDARTMEIAWAAAAPPESDVTTQISLIRKRPPSY